MIRPEPFPTVLFRFEPEQGARPADIANALLRIGVSHVDFDAEQRIGIRGTPVEIPATVVILEQRGIPGAWRKMFGLRVSLMPATQIAR
jgi:hypothetical protein